MKHNQTIAIAAGSGLAFVTALSIALMMLAHATGSGTRQWALGAALAVGCIFGGLIVATFTVVADLAIRNSRVLARIVGRFLGRRGRAIVRVVVRRLRVVHGRHKTRRHPALRPLPRRAPRPAAESPGLGLVYDALDRAA